MHPSGITAAFPTFPGNHDRNKMFRQGRAYALRLCSTNPDNPRVAEITDDLGCLRVISVDPVPHGLDAMSRSAHLRPSFTPADLKEIKRLNNIESDYGLTVHCDNIMGSWKFTRVPLKELCDVRY